MRRHSEGLLRQSSFKGVSAPTDRWRATLRKSSHFWTTKRGQAFMGFLTLVQLLIVPLVKGVVTS
jgi:hypothetical protein